MRRSAAVGGLGLSLLASGAGAQQVRAPELLRTPEGIELDFAPNGVWRVRAREVSQYRTQLLARQDYSTLNAPLALRLAAPGALAVRASIAGTLYVPTVLVRFQDVGTAAASDPSRFQEILYASQPPSGRPYTVSTLYGEMSNGLLQVDGRILGWVTLDSAEAAYTGAAGSCPSNPYGTDNCNGIFGTGFSRLQVGLREALTKLDQSVDFGGFDNDGADGQPNSGDDDGYVDLVVFIHSEIDGACVSRSNNHVWAHRSSALAGFPSGDPSARGGAIRFRDYTIQSGVGGVSGCDTTDIMGIGTTAHETGHAFGLPDLYDTGLATEGAGEWDLMAAGNWSTQMSPTRLSAWSLNELGWVAIRELADAGTHSLAAATSDTALLVRPDAANPRGEYLLLENRQPLESDSAMIRIHCQRSGQSFPSTCGGGLAVWHIDSAKVATSRWSNSVNAGSIQGVALLQADGLNSLRQAPYNRGDAGDLWPGAATRTRFSFNTEPPARTNTGAFMGFELDSIRLAPEAAVTFRLQFGGLTVVRSSDPAASVLVDGTRYLVFEDLLSAGSVHSVGIDSVQTTPDGRTRFSFEQWSDGGAQGHDFTASAIGDTLIATVHPAYLVRVAVSGQGTVRSAPSVDLTTGAFFDAGAVVVLVAEPAPGHQFDRWAGDVVTASDTLTLAPLSRPFELVARFVAPPAVALDVIAGQLLGLTQSLSPSDLRYLDLAGNQNGRFDLGDFLAYMNATEGQLSAEALNAVLERGEREDRPARVGPSRSGTR